MVEMLIAYSEGRANANNVMRALTSHRGWFVPLALFTQGGEENIKVDSLMMLGNETRLPPGELWIFTDAEAATLAQAQGAELGAYAGRMAGTKLFRSIGSNVETVRVNPGSPRERMWEFRESSATTVGGIWAEAIALEESFGEWKNTGVPDKTALLNYRAYMLYDHVSGVIITLPNQEGMTNPIAAFTAPDCADMFLSELSEEEIAVVRPVTIDGNRLLGIPRLGLDGVLFNLFGPGVTYALPFDILGPE